LQYDFDKLFKGLAGTGNESCPFLVWLLDVREQRRSRRYERSLDFFGGRTTANLAVMAKETAGMFALEKFIR
jgi:hypothetical protein